MSQWAANPDGPGITYQRYIRTINFGTSLTGDFDVPLHAFSTDLLLGIDVTAIGTATVACLSQAQLGGCAFFVKQESGLSTGFYASWRGTLPLANLLHVAVATIDPCEISILAWGVNLGYYNPSYYDPPIP